MKVGALAAGLILVGILTCGCFGRTPQTHYYQLVPRVDPRPLPAPQLVIAVERFRADTAYDDERIVYRPSPYRLEYYYYHRWSSRPGLQVADFLRDVYARSGHFRQVGSHRTPETELLVSGRIRALEEVDEREDKWLGRIALDLDVRAAATGNLLWSRSFEELVPLPQQSPEGLTRALSQALTRIGTRTAPVIARLGAGAFPSHQGDGGHPRQTTGTSGH